MSKSAEIRKLRTHLAEVQHDLDGLEEEFEAIEVKSADMEKCASKLKLSIQDLADFSTTLWVQQQRTLNAEEEARKAQAARSLFRHRDFYFGVSFPTNYKYVGMLAAAAVVTFLLIHYI